jgi:hypothetical protein
MYWHLSDIPALQRLEEKEQARLLKIYSRRLRWRFIWWGLLISFVTQSMGHILLRALGQPDTFFRAVAMFVICGTPLMFIYHNFRWREINRLILADHPDWCRTCGYDLRETSERCPECGTPKPSIL